MKQTIFETRQRANDLLKEAIAIWRQSDQSNRLEGIEDDPVFSLLMMALAYQANEADSEIEHLKEEVLDDFARLLTPYEVGCATPATAVVETQLQVGIPEMTLGADKTFTLASEYNFMPLLETRALNCAVGSIVRIDGRRWKVKLNFAYPVQDLSGFSFAVKDLNFRDLTVTLNKQPLPLIKPWQCSELPFSTFFSLDSMTYNRAQVFNASMLPLDLFARQNVSLFCIDKHNGRKFIPTEEQQLELIFEFSGISENFLFDKSRLAVNTTVLVNARQHEATLTSQMPIARVAGYSDLNYATDVNSRQFMHLHQPLDVQIFGKTELEVRRSMADRFNQGSLVKLLNCIITKYHSDFYAFQNVKELSTDKMIYNLQELLSRLIEATTNDSLHNTPGVYLLLHRRNQLYDRDFSLTVKYLTTAGAAVNTTLSATDTFSVPSGLSASGTRMIAPPVMGTDELSTDVGTQTMLRYYMLTSDRIVTPADIKVFCYKELMARYGISNNMVKRIRVNHRQTRNWQEGGYEILVELVLADSSFIRRNFADKLPVAENMLQRMMEVRSTHVYPINVSISIEE